MGTLAKADAGELLRLYSDLKLDIQFNPLKPPETGLVMVRGKSGGVGRQFNLGEMTVTRGAVRLETGETGLSYVAGRDKKHAETAAVIDALMQRAENREQVRDQVLYPLEKQAEEKRKQVLRQRAATRVDFFTMTRDREDKK